MRGKILAAVFAICILSLPAMKTQAAPDNTSPKKMQIGAPFTLIFELIPNAEPNKVDNIVNVGNRILLGHSKTSFDWYIASTSNKWIKLTAGKAKTGDTVKVALTYDGSTLRSYYNGAIAASSQVNRQQFTGVMPIILNEWHGDYNLAYAFAKTLSALAIKSFQNAEPQSPGSANVEPPAKSTVSTPTSNTKPTAAVDPTQPVDIGPADTTQPTDVQPVETPSEPSGSSEVQPVQPVTTDTSQPTDIQPVQPVTEDSNQPTDVQPVEPVQAPSEAPSEKPTKPSANTPSAPADLPSDTTVKRTSITAKVLAITTVPDPSKILPYKHAIVTQEVQVVSVDKGALKGIKKGDKLRIARWGILQGQKTDVAKVKVGDVVKLPLEDYKDHPELERQYTVDTLPESFDLPYLLDVSE